MLEDNNIEKTNINTNSKSKNYFSKIIEKLKSLTLPRRKQLTDGTKQVEISKPEQLKFERMYEQRTKNKSNTQFIIEVYHKFSKEKANKLLQNNFSTIICDKYGGTILNLIILLRHKENIDFVQKNLYKEIPKMYLLEIEDLMDRNPVDFKLDMKSMIEQNADYLITNIKEPEKVIALCKDREKFTIEAKEKFDEYINNHPAEYIKYTLKGKNDKENLLQGELKEKTYGPVYDVLTKLTLDLCKRENVKVSDVKLIGIGGYSKVVEVGDKVLKYGDQRATYNIPNDKRILNPLIRVNLHNFDPLLFGTIEISDKVDVVKGISSEEIYSLYKEMRERGIICTDLRYDNVGFLLKENKITDKSVADIPKAKGLDGQIPPSQKGELVIFDTDYIFREDDPYILWGNAKAKDYERRYLKEKYGDKITDKEIDEKIEELSNSNKKTNNNEGKSIDDNVK